MSSNIPDTLNTGSLDSIRLKNGAGKLKVFYNDLAKKDTEKAIGLINDRNLQFPSLFILQSEIIKSELYNFLSGRNQRALQIAKSILTRSTSGTSIQFRDDDYPVFRWILETGYMEDGLNEQYDEVLDTSALLLVKHFKDRSYLYNIEEMIFSRYRKGSYIYDLTWAYFDCSDSGCLNLIAKRLLSNHPRDVELARKLLNFIPNLSQGSNPDRYKQYRRAVRWINENKNFIVYTGESFQQTNNPNRYTVSLDMKYLQKPVSSANDEIARTLSNVERNLLSEFHTMDYNTKLLLSSCSHTLYRQNRYWWNRWLNYPLKEQINYAKRMLGGI